MAIMDQRLMGGLLGGAHEKALDLLRHWLAGSAIALMAGAGVVGTLINFWPR